MSNNSAFQFARKKLAVATILATLGTCPIAAVLAQSNPANLESASIQSSQHEYTIIAQDLSEALIQFGRQSDIEVTAATQLVVNKRTNGVEGVMSVEQAITTLLEDTGLSYQLNGSLLTLVVSSSTISIINTAPVGSAVTELALTQVGATDEENQAFDLARINAPISEIARSISVVSSEQISDQSIASLTEALRYTPGVFSEVNGVNHRYASISARGFNGVDTNLDGMSTYLGGGFIMPDTYGLERVSMMRGPSSTLYGNGSLGGVIDLSTKKPTGDPLREVELLSGSYKHFEGRLDISDAVMGNENLRYRLTATWRDSGTQIDFVDDDSLYIAPAISWALPNTDIVLSGYYQEESGGNLSLALPLTGSLLPHPLGQVDNSMFFGEPETDDYDAKTVSMTWDIDHRINDNWSIQHQARYNDVHYYQNFLTTIALMSDLFATPPFSFIFPAAVSNPELPLGDTIAFVPAFPPFAPTALMNVSNPLAGLVPLSTIMRNPIGYYNPAYSITTDTHLLGELMTGASIQHNVLAGVDYSKNNTEFTYLNETLDFANIDSLLDLIVTLSPIDVFNPVYGQGTPSTVTQDTASSVRPKEIRQMGFYFQDRISINEKLILTVGLRHDKYDDYQFNRLGTGYNRDLKESNTTYQGGINYLFNSGITPYFSYSESFEPQTGNDYLQRAFEPITGTQYEVGVKYNLNDSTLITLAYFDLSRNNLAIADDLHFGCAEGNPLSTCQQTAGEVVSSGVELEITGRPIPELNFMVSYSTNDVHVSIDDDPAVVGKSLTRQPDKQASIWAKYDFSGGFAISAGARYVGETFADQANTMIVPSFSVFDLGFYYQIDDGFDLSLNASNVTDKQYLASCNTTTCSQGISRKVTASVKYRW